MPRFVESNQYIYTIENNSCSQKGWFMPDWPGCDNSWGIEPPPTTVGKRINQSKTKVTKTALISYEQRQTAMLDGETLEGVQHSLTWKPAFGRGKNIVS